MYPIPLVFDEKFAELEFKVLRKLPALKELPETAEVLLGKAIDLYQWICSLKLKDLEELAQLLESDWIPKSSWETLLSGLLTTVVSCQYFHSNSTGEKQIPFLSHSLRLFR